MDYHMWGAMLEAYCKLKPPKAENNGQSQGSTSGYLGDMPQRPIDKAVKDLPN